MNFLHKLTRILTSASAVVLLGLGLNACSSSIGDYGIEYNGAIFNALGIGASGPKGDPKMAQRAPLVIPPGEKKLPVPGPRSAQAEAMAWPDDPDARKIRMAKQAAKKQQENCGGDVDVKTIKGIDGIEKMVNPSQGCNSIFSVFANSQLDKSQDTSEDSAP